jgi:hypothetical protein
MFLSFLFDLSFVEWIIVAAGIVFLLASSVSYSNERYGASGFTLVLSFAAFGFLMKDVFKGLALSAMVVPALKIVGLYLVIGAIVSLFNWFVFVIQVKNRYRNIAQTNLQRESFLETVKGEFLSNLTKAARHMSLETLNITALSDAVAHKIGLVTIVHENHVQIFGRAYSGRLDFERLKFERIAKMNEDDLNAYLDRTLAFFFPPKTRIGMPILVSAVFEWPAVIISNLFSRFITAVVEKLVWISRKGIDAVSGLLFGSHNIELD